MWASFFYEHVENETIKNNYSKELDIVLLFNCACCYNTIQLKHINNKCKIDLKFTEN